MDKNLCSLTILTALKFHMHAGLKFPIPFPSFTSYYLQAPATISLEVLLHRY